MKKYGLFMAAALVLAGCSDDYSVKEEVDTVIAAEVEDVAEETISKIENIEVDRKDLSAGEEVVEESKDSSKKEETIGESTTSEPVEIEEVNLEGSDSYSTWYEQWTDDKPITVEEEVDFNQDGQAEIILGTPYNLVVGAFNEATNEWETVYQDNVWTMSLNGVMENEIVGQMAAVVTAPTYPDGDTSTVVRLLRYSEGENGLQVVEAFRSDETRIEKKDLEYVVNQNKLSILGENGGREDRHYELQGNMLKGLDEEIYLFDGLPLTSQQAFVDLFPEYFASGILLGDSYNTAVEKAGEGTAGYFYGSHMLSYNGYNTLYQKEDNTIDHLILTGSGELTVEDLEQAIGQNLDIESIYTEIEGYIYIADFTFEGVPYEAHFDNEDGDLKFLSVGQ